MGPDQSRRHPLDDDFRPHHFQLPITRHAAGGTPDEVEAPNHEAELVLQGRVRHHERRYLLTPDRLALQKTSIAGQEHAPLLDRNPDK